MLIIRNANIAVDALALYSAGMIDISSPNFTAAAIHHNTEGSRKVSSAICPAVPSPRERRYIHWMKKWRTSRRTRSVRRNAASGRAT
jgi:hypothetical protein